MRKGEQGDGGRGGSGDGRKNENGIEGDGVKFQL